jgi:hypothetical protein
MIRKSFALVRSKAAGASKQSMAPKAPHHRRAKTVDGLRIRKLVDNPDRVIRVDVNQCESCHTI